MEEHLEELRAQLAGGQLHLQPTSHEVHQTSWNGLLRADSGVIKHTLPTAQSACSVQQQARRPGLRSICDKSQAAYASQR